MADAKKPESLQNISQSCEDAEKLLDNIEIKEKEKRTSAFIHKEQTREYIYEGKRGGGEAWEESFESKGTTKTIVAATGIAIFIAVLIGGINEESKQRASKQQEKSSSSTTAPFWKYKKALKTSSNAVLVSEHRNAIKEIKEVLDLGLNSSTMNRGLLNNRIIQARKAIKYIDQKGEDKYDEYSDYGMQWYDEGERGSHKLFFTYSKMCKQPLISFEYKRGKGGPVIGRTTRVPTSNISTILIPYGTQPDTWLYVTDFRCN